MTYAIGRPEGLVTVVARDVAAIDPLETPGSVVDTGQRIHFAAGWSVFEGTRTACNAMISAIIYEHLPPEDAATLVTCRRCLRSEIVRKIRGRTQTRGTTSTANRGLQELLP